MSNRAARYQEQKRRTIESFLAFTRGEGTPCRPLEVFLEISNVCNLKCAMCPTFSALNPWRFYALRDAERGFLPLDELLTQLEPALIHALNVHCFGYGEPTVHPGFLPLLEKVARYEVLIDFFTNGMHLTDDICRALVELGVFGVTVSFSGTSKEEYENVYLGGVYEQVLAGMRRLADAKAAAGSKYPLISINSLAFEHHVDRFDDFVELMAANGANIVHLKALQVHASIPQLKGHASVYRQEVEGKILERAAERARALDVLLSTEQYLRTAVVSEQEWTQKKAYLVAGPESAHAEGVQLVAIERFREQARLVEPLRPPPRQQDNRTEQQAADVVQLYQIGATPDAGDFFCAEPFKTMYVRQDGKIKPCCFGNNEAAPLGTLPGAAADEIWQNERYGAIRQGIIERRYSKQLCGACLKHKMGPHAHGAHGLIRDYGQWFAARFGTELSLPPVWRYDTFSTNPQIAARFRGLPVPTEIHSLELSAIDLDLAVQLHARVFAGSAYDDLLQGHLDKEVDGFIFGWLWSPARPDLRLKATIYDGNQEVGTVVADRHRTDLEAAGIGDGCHGFSLRLPRGVYDGKEHHLLACLAGSPALLRESPLVVRFG